jgi:hypothetical protein
MDYYLFFLISIPLKLEGGGTLKLKPEQMAPLPAPRLSPR